jgi:hypothetical protein
MSKAIAPLAVAIQAGVPVHVIGEPGTGKTSVIERALAPALGVPCETLIASIRDTTDFGGLPYMTDTHGVKLAPPEWAQRLVKMGKGIAFFDEITTAPPAVQAALLRVILDRWVGDVKLPDSISMVAASNPIESAAGGNELAAPLANRFCHIRWSVDVKGWIEGMLNGFAAPRFPMVPDDWRDGIIHTRPIVAGFIQSKAQALLVLPKTESDMGKAWPSPRTWDMVSKLMAANNAAGAGTDTEIALVSGCVGEGMGLEFLHWRNALDLPNPEDLIAQPSKFVVPERGDQTFTILASVASCVVANMTKTRYLNAWQIFNTAAKKGKKDIAAASVTTLVVGAKGKPFLADKDVRDTMREIMVPFIEILKQAGLTRDAV